MITRSSSKTREWVTANGEVLLSHNHIALLHGLYDRPNGQVTSRAEWVRAAAPFIERMKGNWDVWGLRGAMLTVHSRWAAQERRGRFITATLTDRGRAIVEREVPAWIRGRGLYQGLQSVDRAAMINRQIQLPDCNIREAVEYSRTFGLPLLIRSVHRTGGIVFAVSAGLAKPFRLRCYEELHGRGPQSWHWEWSRESVAHGNIPSGYLDHFSGHDAEDVIEYLQEIQDTEAELGLYIRVYNDTPLLSRSRIAGFLSAEVNLRSMDFPEGEMVECVRRNSTTYQRVIEEVESRLSWVHPDTGRPVGFVYEEKSGDNTSGIIVTSPEALSCLQRFFDHCNANIGIETRYE